MLLNFPNTNTLSLYNIVLCGEEKVSKSQTTWIQFLYWAIA